MAWKALGVLGTVRRGRGREGRGGHPSAPEGQAYWGWDPRDGRQPALCQCRSGGSELSVAVRVLTTPVRDARGGL